MELVRETNIETVVLLAITLGLRRSEALGVPWGAIDFLNQTLTIKHTVTVTEAEYQAKNNAKIKNATSLK